MPASIQSITRRLIRASVPGTTFALLAADVEIMADLIVNHISSRSPQFLDFHEERRKFSLCRNVSDSRPRLPRRRARVRSAPHLSPTPGPSLYKTRLANGTEHLLWTTFTSEQVDIDVRHPAGRHYLTRILDQFQDAGIRVIRLDAVGYAIKKAGTSCFMIPETFDFIAELRADANARGIEVLVEIHTHYQDQIEIAKQADWVYDFALPPLVLHTLYGRDARQLETLARNQPAQRSHRARHSRRNRRARCRPDPQ